MSLIVARKSEGQLCIVSDTKLTYPSHEIKGLKTKPSDGVIKTIIINTHVSISFAGDIDDAELALKHIHDDSSIETIIDNLKEHHRLSGYKTEFLLCYGRPSPTIYKFKKGEYGPVESAWIGDQNAFSRFQESMMGVVRKEKKRKKVENHKVNLPVSNKPVVVMEAMELGMEVAMPAYFSKMSSAMDQVIDDSNIFSVGGFKVCVIYKDMFLYNVYGKNYRGQFALVGEGEHVIGHGDAGEGAYSINFFGGSEDYKTVGLHIRQAKLGIAYRRIDNGLLRPSLHFMDEVDFYDLAIEKYALHASFTTVDRVHKFSVHGRQAFSSKDFKKASTCFEKAAASAKGKQKAELLFYKGISLLNLKDHINAKLMFKEALNNDASIQDRINQLFRR